MIQSHSPCVILVNEATLLAEEKRTWDGWLQREQINNTCSVVYYSQECDFHYRSTVDFWKCSLEVNTLKNCGYMMLE